MTKKTARTQIEAPGKCLTNPAREQVSRPHPGASFFTKEADMPNETVGKDMLEKVREGDLVEFEHEAVFGLVVDTGDGKLGVRDPEDPFGDICAIEDCAPFTIAKAGPNHGGKTAAELMEEGRRWVYDVDELDYLEGEGYAVRLVFENEPGFFRMDWRWGGPDRNLQLAKDAAIYKNGQRGIDEKEALKIVLSSMFYKG